MSRFDKITRVFRIQLAANFGYTSNQPDLNNANLGQVWGVAMNANGQAIIGAVHGSSTNKGVTIINEPKAAGETIDVMTHGEIVNFTDSAGVAVATGVDVFAANTTGKVDATTGGSPVGFTIEAGRLIVNVGAPVAVPSS